jgi:hypothetical protein
LFDYGREREEEAIVDVARASDQIDAPIERRVSERGRANAEEEFWNASVRKHHAKLQGERGAEWSCYFSALASSLRASADDEFDARAEALLEEREGAQR